MKKYLLLVIVLILFLCTSCKINSSDSYVKHNGLSNNNNNYKITTWEDKNFEALIRYYLGNFDGDIYYKDLNNITELSIKSNSSIKTNIKECEIPKEYYDKIDLIISMKDIDNFNNLKKVTLCCNKIETIHTYKNSSNIEYLDLSFNNIVDITNINKYNNLTYFDISDNYIKNIKPLENLTRLKELSLANIGLKADNIFGCKQSEIDIDYIDDLKDLEILDIGNSKILNVSKFNQLNNLTFLKLFMCTINEDELCFSNCNNLENLVLHFYNSPLEHTILDINKLDSLINLKSLVIGNAFINKSESFSQLTSLKSISFTNVVLENIEILESLSNLEKIYSTETNIESLKYLKNNKNIKFISVTYGNLSDISDLKLFTNIENLILPDNKITDISVLTQLNNLKKIILVNNPIKDNSVIEELKKREGIVIDY